MIIYNHINTFITITSIVAKFTKMIMLVYLYSLIIDFVDNILYDSSDCTLNIINNLTYTDKEKTTISHLYYTPQFINGQTRIIFICGYVIIFISVIITCIYIIKVNYKINNNICWYSVSNKNNEKQVNAFSKTLEEVQQGVQQEVQQGIQQGIQQGVQQGVHQGVHQEVQQEVQQEILNNTHETISSNRLHNLIRNTDSSDFCMPINRNEEFPGRHIERQHERFHERQHERFHEQFPKRQHEKFKNITINDLQSFNNLAQLIK